MTESSLVAINIASAEQIESLYGIGPQLAARIVAHREAEGFYFGIGDLANVPGISQRLATSVAPHIDWRLPLELRPQQNRDYITAAKWLILGVAIIIVTWPAFPMTREILNGYELTKREWATFAGTYGGLVLALCGCLLRASASISTNHRRALGLQKASNILSTLGIGLVLSAMLLQTFDDIQAESYTEPTVQIRILWLSVTILILLPQLIFYFWPTAFSQKYLVHWINILFALFFIAVAVWTYMESEGLTYRLAAITFGVLFGVRMGWGFVTGSLPVQPLVRKRPEDVSATSRQHISTGGRSHSRPKEASSAFIVGVAFSALAAVLTVATAGARLIPLGLAILFTAFATYSAWRYMQSRQLTSVSLVTAVIAIILLAAVARAASSNDIPRFEGSFAPFEGSNDLIEFLDRNEEKVIYLSVDVTADDYVDVEKLYPPKQTDPSILTIWGFCDGPPESDKDLAIQCSQISVTIQGRTDVEPHVHAITAATHLIQGYFAVGVITGHMGEVNYPLEPLSFKDIELGVRTVR